MKKRNVFFIILVSAAVVVGLIFLVGVVEKESQEEEKAEMPENIERIKNILSNSFFEEELSPSNWELASSGNNYESGFDDLVKYEGSYSFNITSLNDSAEIFLVQKIDKIDLNRKLSLLGFIKTEDCDSARFEIDFFYGDSLLASGYSPSAEGTTDWEEYNAWIKTFLSDNFDKDQVRAEIKCALYGKGRVWFDNVRLYSIPLRRSIYEFESYID